MQYYGKREKKEKEHLVFGSFFIVSNDKNKIVNVESTHMIFIARFSSNGRMYGMIVSRRSLYNISTYGYMNFYYTSYITYSRSDGKFQRIIIGYT